MIRPTTMDFLSIAKTIGWDHEQNGNTVNLRCPLESGNVYTFSAQKNEVLNRAEAELTDFCPQIYIYERQNDLHSARCHPLSEAALQAEAQEIAEHLKELNTVFDRTINLFLVSNLLKKAEDLDWAVVQEDADSVFLRKFSPAGEDFGICVSTADIVSDVRQQILDFDTEDHVSILLQASRNGLEGVPDLKTLTEDADAIEEMLRELANELETVEEMYYKA